MPLGSLQHWPLDTIPRRGADFGTAKQRIYNLASQNKGDRERWVKELNRCNSQTNLRDLELELKEIKVKLAKQLEDLRARSGPGKSGLSSAEDPAAVWAAATPSPLPSPTKEFAGDGGGGGSATAGDGGDAGAAGAAAEAPPAANGRSEPELEPEPIGNISVSINTDASREAGDESGKVVLELNFKVTGMTTEGEDGKALPLKLTVLDKFGSAKASWKVTMQSEKVEGHVFGAVFGARCGFQFPVEVAVDKIYGTALKVLVYHAVDEAQSIGLHPICHGQIDRAEAEKRLEATGKKGTYLYRQRDAVGKSYAFSIMGDNGKFVHSKVDVGTTTVSFDGTPEPSLSGGASVAAIMQHPLKTRGDLGLVCGDGLPDKTPAWQRGMQANMQQVEWAREDLLGFAEFTIADVLCSADKSIMLPVRDGTVLESASAASDAASAGTGYNSMLDDGGGIHTGPAPSLASHTEDFVFDVPIVGGRLCKCKEIMSESEYFLTVPNQLLRIFVAEDKTKARHLENLQGLSGRLEEAHKAALLNNTLRVGTYLQQVAFIDGYSGSSFKKSTAKKSNELSMFAVNLHAQRLDVETVLVRKGQGATVVTPLRQYSIVSHGAFAAHSLGYKQGGLRKMLKTSADGRKWAVPCQRIYVARRKVLELQESMKVCTEKIATFLLLNMARGDVRTEIRVAATQFAGVLAELDRHLKFDEAVNESFQQVVKVEREKGLPHPAIDTLCKTLEETWKVLIAGWTGIENMFATSRSPEPAAVEKQVQLAQRHLRTCTEQFDGMTAATVDHLLLYELRMSPSDGEAENVLHRRDVAFSQALTTLTTVFIQRLKDKIPGTKADRAQLFDPMVECGYLVVFESLLSTQGPEIVMIEDMAQAVEDLGYVRVRLSACTESNKRQPFEVKITGQRYNFIVDVSLESALLDRFPQGFKERKGVQVVPIMFTQGVNEMQMMARNVGSTDLQEDLCEEALHKISEYAKKFKKVCESKRYNRSSVEGIDELLGELDKLIRAKQAKYNLDILQKAQTLTRKMNGGRCTCCKSGKDRTGMSVTLEELSILQEYHKPKDEKPWSERFLTYWLDYTRSKGCRIMNVTKNIGEPRYAFNKFQVMALPKLLRPPADSFGASTT